MILRRTGLGRADKPRPDPNSGGTVHERGRETSTVVDPACGEDHDWFAREGGGALGGEVDAGWDEERGRDFVELK